MPKSEFKHWMWFEAVDNLSRAQRLHQQFITLHQHGMHPAWEPPVDVLETDAEVLPIRHVLPPVGADPSIGFDVSEVDFDTVFTGWARRARISWPEHERQLDIETEAPLDFLVFYTPPGEPFFCAEPVSNITDAFNRVPGEDINTGCIVLASGQMRSASARFTPSLAVWPSLSVARSRIRTGSAGPDPRSSPSADR